MAEPKTVQARWDAWGVSKAKWLQVKSKALTSRKIWLFTKGPSFNKSFEWDQVNRDKDFIISVNDAALPVSKYLRYPDLVITYDDRIREYLFEYGLKPIMISAKHPQWPEASTTGDFAFIVIGELGIKYLNAVGLDHGNGNGFDYKFKSLGTETKNEKCKKCCTDVLDRYGISLTYYKANQ
jgi:hypothetical protein